MKKCFLISVTIHTSIIFILINLGLLIKKNSCNIQKINVHVVSSTLSRGQALRETQSTKQSIKPKNPGLLRYARNDEEKKTSHNDEKKRIARSNGKTSSQTALILHNLIQEQIRYPIITETYNKNKINLYFILFPDGHIESEKILQSSGISIFDQASLKGVRNISKIKAAKNLLQNPKEFTVPIEFL